MKSALKLGKYNARTQNKGERNNPELNVDIADTEEFEFPTPEK